MTAGAVAKVRGCSWRMSQASATGNAARLIMSPSGSIPTVSLRCSLTTYVPEEINRNNVMCSLTTIKTVECVV